MDHSLVVAALSMLCLALPGRAATLPNRPMRELIADSDTVVAAVPDDPQAPARFRVLRTYLGTALKEGDVIEIEDLSSYDLTVPAAPAAQGRKPARVAEALLFLGPKKDEAPAARFPLTPLGLRILTADGGAYYPFVTPVLPQMPSGSLPFRLRLGRPAAPGDRGRRRSAACPVPQGDRGRPPPQ